MKLRTKILALSAVCVIIILAQVALQFWAMNKTLEVIQNDPASAAEHLAKVEHLSLFFCALSLIAALVLPLVANFSLFRPQRRMIGVMGSLSSGDYQVQVPALERRDEMGEIARAVQMFKENGQKRQELEAEQDRAREKQVAEDSKRQARAERTDQFAARMQGIIQNVAAAATELFHTSELMGSNIASSTQRLTSVSSASTEASMSVQTVAAAAEELSATVKEITQQITRSSDTVSQAVEQMSEADKTALSLDEAATRIGEIVSVIENIANQINLLALNATIESARAGEAGKGFAVVAGEVKTLATQTSKATGEIATTIASIQTVSKQVLEALSTIKRSITGVQEISTAISAAVEEQSATTNEIANSMGRAATNTTQINHDIREVSQASEQTSNSATEALGAARTLSQEAEKLSREIDDFISEMSAA